MGKYILRRLMYIIFVFFIISIVLFTIYKLVPGDPAVMMLEGAQSSVKPEVYQRMLEEMRRELGLDQPVVFQYFRWIGKMLTGDFGYSIVYRRQVTEVIGTPMLNTVRLNIVNLIFVFMITIPLGITTAVRKGKLYDTVVQTITILGYSLPTFVFAILAIFFFAVKLPLFPISGSQTAGFEGADFEMFKDFVWHMALPVFVMVFTSLGGITRYVRASMIEALRMDYIRTARAKGLKEKVVIYSHAFRNSLIPLITIMIGWFIGVFSGSVMIENIFLWNGMGRTLITSIMRQDYAVAMAINLFYIILALFGNLIMDIGYMFVDPRVKLS